MVTGPETEFFSTAAQVVPVLALAGLLDRPREARPEIDRVAFAVRLAMWFGLLLAEIAAFVALAGRPTPLERTVVITGLAVGGMALVERFVDREFASIEPEGTRLRLVFLAAYATLAIGSLIVVVLAQL